MVEITPGIPAPHIDEGLKVMRVVDGIEEWPCRCGEVHRGDRAIYDWGHHNCRHENYELILLGDDQLLCAGCGNVWDMPEPQTQDIVGLSWSGGSGENKCQ